jgi:hypothetical protein
VQLATEDHRSIEADRQGREEHCDDREDDRLPGGRVRVVLRHHDDGHGGHGRRHEGEPPEDHIERLPPPVGAPDERHGRGDRGWNDNPEVQQEDRLVHAHVGTELGRKRIIPQPRDQGRALQQARPAFDGRSLMPRPYEVSERADLVGCTRPAPRHQVLRPCRA